MCFNGLYQGLFFHNNPSTNYKPFQYISYKQLTSINLIIANTFAVILLWDIETYMLQSPYNNIVMALILVCRFANNLVIRLSVANYIAPGHIDA